MRCEIIKHISFGITHCSCQAATCTCTIAGEESLVFRPSCFSAFELYLHSILHAQLPPFPSPYLLSLHLTSPRLTSPRLTSPHLQCLRNRIVPFRQKDHLAVCELEHDDVMICATLEALEVCIENRASRIENRETKLLKLHVARQRTFACLTTGVIQCCLHAPSVI